MSVLAPTSSLSISEKMSANSKLSEIKEKLRITMAKQNVKPFPRAPEEQADLDEIAKGFSNQIPRISKDDG